MPTLHDPTTGALLHGVGGGDGGGGGGGGSGAGSDARLSAASVAKQRLVYQTYLSQYQFDLNTETQWGFDTLPLQRLEAAVWPTGELRAMFVLASGASERPAPPTHLATPLHFTGIENQGATCYLNSIIQSLFHLPLFRRAVYEMDVSAGGAANAVPRALQRLFAALQATSNAHSAVGTVELTRVRSVW